MIEFEFNSFKNDDSLTWVGHYRISLSFFFFAESRISWSRVRRDHGVQVGHLLPGEAALLE